MKIECEQCEWKKEYEDVPYPDDAFQVFWDINEHKQQTNGKHDRFKVIL